MKFSIITPSYNQGRFIEDAIQSVLNQNYSSFEHIVIDACSTDNTIAVLQKYPHLIWKSEPDEGQSDALNKGLKIATGDVICWLNADDFYLQGTFKKVSTELSLSMINGVYGDVCICDKDKVIKKYKKSHKAFKPFSVFHTFIPSESLFIKREVIENNIRIDKDFHISMDKEFIAHILYKNFKLKHIKHFCACFRVHEANKSSNTREVKLLTAKEGLIILNRYWNLQVPINSFTIKLYRYISIGLLPIRKFFAITFG